MHSNEICDLTNLTANCLGNETFIKKMITVAIIEITSSITKLEENLTAGNAVEIKSIVHALKPTIQNVANPDTFERVKSIESGEVNESWEKQVATFISNLQVLKTELMQQSA